MGCLIDCPICRTIHSAFEIDAVKANWQYHEATVV